MTADGASRTRNAPLLPSLMVLDEVDSTNRWLADQIRAGCRHGFTVRAERQTAGRGRMGRTWVAPHDQNLSMSIALVGPDWLSLAARIPLAAGVAAATALERLAPGTHPGLKWPNDLVLGDQKLGGILCEGVDVAGRFAGIVVGIGINVNTCVDDFGPELRGHLTTLLEATGRQHALDGLAVAIRDELLSLLERPGDVLDAWRQRDATTGRRVEWDSDEGTAQGTADGIDHDGSLRVMGDDGRLHRRASGEVRFCGRSSASPVAR